MTKSETSGKPRPPSPLTPSPSPLSKHYMLFCLASLFLLVMCLTDRGMEWWSLVPALIGCLALLTHWSHGPPLVLASLAVLLGMQWDRRLAGMDYGGGSRFGTPTLMDLVPCLAVLAYVVGHYRLLSIMRPIFPIGSRLPRADARRRSASLVHTWEMALLGLALPVWVALAAILWTWMRAGVPSWDAPRELWRVLRLAWVVLAVLAAIGILASYLRLATATPEESLLYLQDQCWRRTRGEQGRLHRWLTWARLRVQRKKRKKGTS